MDLMYIIDLLLIVYSFVDLIHGQHLLQTFTGEVGPGNFSYFTLSKEGTIMLVLDSLEGDADIYAVQGSTKPDYDFYDMSSCTCGQDMITIPESFTRPVSIGIFGHVWALPLSKYKLNVLIETNVKNGRSGESEYPGEEGENKSGYEEAVEEGQESILWVIFVSILKIVFEIIV